MSCTNGTKISKEKYYSKHSRSNIVPEFQLPLDIVVTFEKVIGIFLELYKPYLLIFFNFFFVRLLHDDLVRESSTRALLSSLSQEFAR